MTRTDVRLANEAWESLMTAHSRLNADFAARPIWGQVSMREYDVLYTLAKRGSEALRICDLQGEVLLSQPALSRLIERLVMRGYVARETDPADGRAVIVSLTAEGAEVQREVGRAHGRDIARALSPALTTEELHELRRLTQKLLDSRKHTS